MSEARRVIREVTNEETRRCDFCASVVRQGALAFKVDDDQARYCARRCVEAGEPTAWRSPGRQDFPRPLGVTPEEAAR